MVVETQAGPASDALKTALAQFDAAADRLALDDGMRISPPLQARACRPLPRTNG